jgi:two-component system OmpR family response regulator
LADNKILVVEDDATLLGVLKYNLTKEGYNVVTAGDGLQGIEVARSQKPDLIILDLMLPKMDGFEVCRMLRKEMIVPIIMLTARIEEVDKIVGLELGADDYLTKPFSMRELLARVRAMLRRTEMVKQEADKTDAVVPQTIHAGDIEIDLSRHVMLRSGKPLELTPKEFDLLVFLARNRGQVLAEALLQKVWAMICRDTGL